MTTAKEDDTLSELRHEYKSVKNELSQYDSFVDNHPFVCIFVPFTLSIVAVIIAAVNSISWVGWVALALFVLSVVMLCIVLARTGKIAKINAKLDDIEHEVKLFHSKSLAAADHNSNRGTTGKDELGLWRDIDSDDNKNSAKGGWVMGVIVIVVVASVISFNQANQRKQEAVERTRQTQTIEQQRTRQEQDAIEQRKLDQQDEANRLQQQQNAIDLYNSTKPSSNDNYRSSTSCTSRAVGSSVYTDCY